MLEFASFTPEEQELVDKIVERGLQTLLAAGIDYDRQGLEMDISAVHAKVPLRLAELAEADAFNFNHDIGGIYGCLNRETGELERMFSPRFAMRKTEREEYLAARAG